MFEELPSIRKFRLLPDASGTVQALSHIEYELDESLADVIDNSIDAEASRVEITFFRNDRAIEAVTIADNGKGMTPKMLETAMQFGVRVSHGKADLGFYGTGLKTASLNQCGSVSVISLRDGEFAAYRWDKEEMGSNWECDQLDSELASKMFPLCFSNDLGNQLQSGTVVLWQRLGRLGVAQDDLNEFISKRLESLKIKLGLVFHRFLESKSLEIVLRTYNTDSKLSIPIFVPPLNPFGYAPKLAAPGYPKTFTTHLQGTGELQLTAHIWPADSVMPAFRLGRRKPTGFQGLYFYRNDRLIQVGGWNEFVKDVTDPELSLARVMVDLPSNGEPIATLQKSAVQLNAGLAQALSRARCGSLTLEDYLEDARRAYRAGSRRPRANGHMPLVPGAGVPAAMQRSVRNIIAKKKHAREVNFEWAPLPKKRIFELDAEDGRILLNRKYRRRILGENRASATDATFAKTLLFLLFKNDFNRERFSAQRKEWLDECNAILFEAMKTL